MLLSGGFIHCGSLGGYTSLDFGSVRVDGAKAVAIRTALSCDVRLAFLLEQLANSSCDTACQATGQ